MFNDIMKREPTTTIAKIQPFIDHLKSLPIELERLLREARVDRPLLDNPENRLGGKEVLALFELAVEATGQEELGLVVGKELRGFSNILAYILLNCETMRECQEKLKHYEGVLDDMVTLELRESGNRATLILHSKESIMDSSRALIDYKVSGTISYIRTLTGSPITPEKVYLSYPEPTNIESYREFFDCPISFNSSLNAIVMDTAYLDLSTLSPNRELLKIFESHAEEVLTRLGRLESYSGKVSSLIMELLQGETPKIDKVAYELAVSVRSLQNKLKDEGTSYSRLLDDVRKELALTYLKDRENSISDISYLLGFSEPSVFHRSFKKWTDSTPGRYRATV